MPSNQHPYWRSDLRATPTEDRDGPCWHVEDPARCKFFRVGAAEFALLSRCDGHSAWPEVVQLANHELSAQAFSDAEAQTVLTWAVQQGLVTLRGAGEAAPLIPQSAPAARWRGNLLSIRIPLGSPDRWCARWLPKLGWLFSAPAFVAWWMLVIVALMDVLVNWPRFVAATTNILVPENWLGLGLAWLALKVVHEAAHGLACKRHGGEVREAGVALILFAPVAYVDVTSSWRFPSRWPRMQTAAAGMYVETALAAGAILLAGWVESSAWQHFLDNVAVMASVTTLLFNLNPLSRFDGYFLLADALRIPNLFARGRQAARQFAARCLCGSPSSAEPTPLLLAAYGFATWLWSITVMLGLIVAAAWYWHGAGLVLSAVLAGSWLISSARGWPNFARQFWTMPDNQRRRAAWRASGLLTCMAALLTCIPWPLATRAPGVIDFEPLSVMRAESSGFVERVLVTEGESVVAGQSLLELRNDDLERERRDLEFAIEQSRAREDSANEQRDAAGVQVEQQQRAALEQRLVERQRQVEHLMLRAPFDGVVIGRQLATLTGSFVAQGRELLSIGDPSRRQFVAVVSQEHLLAAQAIQNQPVSVRLVGRGTVPGRVERVSPRATMRPEHPCLCAPFGGPLPVQTLPPETADSLASSTRFELLQPHFRIAVTLEDTGQQQPFAGELGWVGLDHSRTCGEQLWWWMSRWLTPQSNAKS